MASFAALEARVTVACHSHLANVSVLRAIGEPFDAIIAVAEKDAYGTARISTHTLRYLDSTELAANDLLTIAADTYKVIGQPERINGSEYTAELVKQ